MAYVSKKDLIEKLRPLVKTLIHLNEEVESLVDQIGDVSEDITAALDEAEEE